MSQQPDETSVRRARWSRTFNPAVRPDDGVSRHLEDPQGQPGGRFLHVEGREWGYDPDQVDAFFQRAESLLNDPGRPAADQQITGHDVRSTVFGRARGGYAPEEVDAALDRIEDACARRENQDYIAEHGREAWEERIGALSDLIFGRLERPDGQRFRHPSGSSTRGYAVVDVDALCHAIVDELSRAETVEPDRVRTAVFGPAVGEAAYEEQQVDAFLDKLVDLLLALH